MASSYTILAFIGCFILHHVHCLTSARPSSFRSEFYHTRFTFSQLYVAQRTSQAEELIKSNAPWNSLSGQADRAFRYGMQLEKNGQARKASAAFHEAATLYQCYLNWRNEFRHVTVLKERDARTILADTCTRLGFLNRDALGDPKAAIRLYKEAAKVDPYPSHQAYLGWGEAIEAASGGLLRLEEAIAAYRKALGIAPHIRETLFCLAVALERLADATTNTNTNTDNDCPSAMEAGKLMEQLRRDEMKYACLVDSWGYVRWHTRHHQAITVDLNLYRGTRDMMAVALDASLTLRLSSLPDDDDDDGLVCEFGVGSGRSIRLLQELLPLDAPIQGFDTFTGLPQPWGEEPAGAYSTGGMVPNILEGQAITFHKGLFADTVPRFLQRTGPESYVAFATIDCCLYSSTLDVLEALHGRIIPGTILLFSEYICHATWRQDAFRAWRESCKRFGWKYEYLAFSLSTRQAIVRVLDA